MAPASPQANPVNTQTPTEGEKKQEKEKTKTVEKLNTKRWKINLSFCLAEVKKWKTELMDKWMSGSGSLNTMTNC